MIMIDMPMPEKCKDCIFHDENCSCIASDYNGVGINVGCALRTDRLDVRCPLKHIGNYYSEVFNCGYKAGKESIIRCKDCKHLEHMYSLDDKNGKKCYVCKKHTFTGLREPDWYCADGERKDDE